MNENEFRKKYQNEKASYQAWGEYVKETIISALREEGKTENILKIPVCPRVKDEDSIIAKAYYRGKKYKDPYFDITDKVGIRFVVLTTDEINIIKKIVERIDKWTYSEDVDYEENIKQKPEIFNYQSVHYIVRSCSEIVCNGIKVNIDTPCEIQIRTLLQHAYAELSHDTVYKKKEEIPSHVKRVLARSMALIETTDILFKEVYDVLRKEDSRYTEFNKWADKYCTFENSTERLNRFIYSSYQKLLINNQITISDLDKFIQGRTYLQERIKDKKKLNILYRQPIILLLFYLIKNFRCQMLLDWPLDDDILSPIFTDLGVSFDSV